MKSSIAHASLREQLKAHGLRYSKPREAILSFFAERDRHVSAENLHFALKQRGENISLSTVYLNLGVLRDAGLVREFSGLSGEALYDSNVREEHDHLICHGCGAVLDIPVVTVNNVPLTQFLQQHAERASGWQVDEPEVEFKGVCPLCQQQNKRESEQAA